MFVGYVEQQIFKQYIGHIPDFFGRYIDDCLGTASCTRADLEGFINYVNGFHHALKFTWEISETCVSFLDISVSINGDALATSVSYKPIHTVIFCFLPPTLTTPRNPSLTPNFCALAAFAAMTKILRPNLLK